MQVSVESGEGLKRAVRVDLSAEDIEKEVDNRLRKYARSARIPGFRPGKAPVKVLQRQYGEQVLAEVFNEKVQATLPEALQQEQLRLVGVPEVEPDVDAKERRYAYTARFEVLPTIELKLISGAEIKRPVAEVTDADIDQMIERLREQRKTWNDVERPAQDGDRVTVSFVGKVEGEPFEGGTAENYPIEIGAGRMIAGFEEQLIGASAGGSLIVNATFPDDYRATHLAGKEGRFEVDVRSVAEAALPEIDEEFLKTVGVDSAAVEDFRKDLRETMETQLARKVTESVKSQVLEALLEANPIEVPQALIDQEVKSMRERLAGSASGQSLSFADDLFADSARRRVATGLLVGAAVNHFDLTVDDEAIRAKVTELAADLDQPEQAVNNYLNNSDSKAQIRGVLIEEQVIARLQDDVRLEDEPMSCFELLDKNG